MKGFRESEGRRDNPKLNQNEVLTPNDLHLFLNTNATDCPQKRTSHINLIVREDLHRLSQEIFKMTIIIIPFKLSNFCLTNIFDYI